MKCFVILLLCYISDHSITNATAHSNKGDDIYYYSTLEFVETPLSYLKGSIPLSRDQALSRNHYRFTYNAYHQLLSIEFYNGNTPRDPNHTANLFTLAHRIVFTYSDTTERMSFFDTRGQLTKVLGNCNFFVYQLNDLGFRESLHFEDELGNRIENSWHIYRYLWQYQSDGSVIENRFNQADTPVSIRPGFEFYRLRLFFNPLGHIALMQNIDEAGQLVENDSGAAQDRISTNAAGNFLQWQVLDKNGELERGNGPNIAIGIQTFDEYGNETRLESRNEFGDLIYSHYGICISETRFDHYGNMVERRFYNDSEAPDVHAIARYHQLVIRWDPAGNYRKELAYFDTTGSKTLHAQRGFHQVLYDHDEAGNLVRLRYLDTTGQLVNRKDNGTAYIQYQYDQNGQLLQVIRFSKDHQEIKE